MNWQPRKHEVFIVKDNEKDLYMQNDPSSEYSDFQWPFRVGIHKRGAEFPVAVVRKVFTERGYECYLSAKSTPEIPTYLLERLPGIRRKGDVGYKKMIDEFGEERIKRLHQLATEEREAKGIPGIGGDPDLFVKHREDTSDRFFVEVKLEDPTKSSKYKDEFRDNQLMLFPLIEKVLDCDVRLAIVSISDSER